MEHTKPSVPDLLRPILGTFLDNSEGCSSKLQAGPSTENLDTKNLIPSSCWTKAVCNKIKVTDAALCGKFLILNGHQYLLCFVIT